MLRELTRRRFLALGGGALLAPWLGRGAAAASLRESEPHPVDFALDIPGDLLRSRSRRAAGAARRRWLETPPLRAPKPFDLIGLRWAGSARPRVELRARRAGGPWTPWVRTPWTGAHGPDGSPAIPGTEPVWVGGADELQLRLDRRARDLRAHFVNSTGTTGAPQRRRAVLRRALDAALNPSVAAAQVPTGQPTVITREQWGGDECPPRAVPRYGEVNLAFVHHTVTANDYGPEQSAAIVLGICRYHRNVNGWDDLGYNLLVDRYGQIFEGRAGGIEQAVVGAQAQGYNNVSTGIASLGTFSTTGQTDAGLAALARLIAWKLSLHGAPVAGEVTVISGGGSVNRYPTGTAVTLSRISGHRDADATACPGDGLYQQLGRLRALAAAEALKLRPPPISIRADRARLRYPARARLSGRLNPPDGSSPQGATIAIQAKNGAVYSTVATTRAGADGRWAATVRRSRNTTFRALHVAAAGAVLTSPVLTVAVSPSVRISVNSKQVAPGSVAVVSGRVRPPKRRLSLVVERAEESGRYRRVATLPVRARRGKFRLRVRFRRPGRHRITAVAKADALNAADRSRALHVRARAG